MQDNLYEIDSITWALTGNVFKKNPLNIKRKLKQFPFLDNFFLLINEFHRPDETTQENLYTKGGELYYNNGKEYIGSYHIHPTKGPMEGPIHTSSFHFRLYYVDTLPIFTNNETDPYQQFLNQDKEIICNKCQNGYPVSQKFNGSCPNGWTSSKDPCKDTKSDPVQEYKSLRSIPNPSSTPSTPSRPDLPTRGGSSGGGGGGY